AGDLDPERLALAAYCGHPAARQALGDDAPAIPAELVAWAYGLERWGKEAAVRAAIAAAAHVLPRFEAELPERPETREHINRARSWLYDPQLVSHLQGSARVWWVPDGASDAAQDAAGAAWAAWVTAKEDASRAAGALSRAADAAGDESVIRDVV